MKTLFIIGITLWFLISLLKRLARNPQKTPPATGSAADHNPQEVMARRSKDTPVTATLKAELGASGYSSAVSRGAGPDDPEVVKADEHFRVAASQAPRDASILMDWAQWKARLTADNDELRIPTYRDFVEPMLRKAAEIDPTNGEIPYYHALLLENIAAEQQFIAEEVESSNESEFRRLLHERENLLWNALDLVELAEQNHHDLIDCLHLRAGLFIAMAEKRHNGEDKYLLQKVKGIFEEIRKRNGSVGSADEEYVDEMLEALKSEMPVPVTRPAKRPASRTQSAAPAVEKPLGLDPSAAQDIPGFGRIKDGGSKKAETPAAPSVPPEAGASARKHTTSGVEALGDYRQVLDIPLDSAAAKPQEPVAGISAPRTPEPATETVDFARAAAAMAPIMPEAAGAPTGFQAAPRWEAPTYSVPEYARPKTDTAQPTPAIRQPLAEAAKPEKPESSVGAHRPLSHRPPAR